MHTLRAGQAVLELCGAMDAACPGALVINLGQPVARTTRIFLDRGYRCFGIGRTPLQGANGLDTLTKRLQGKPETMEAVIAGLPGFTFLLALRDREAESAAASPLDAAQRCAARESARTVLFDLMGLMQILERTDESSEEAN